MNIKSLDINGNDDAMTLKFIAAGGNSIFEFGDNVSDKFVFTGEGIHSNNNISTTHAVGALGFVSGSSLISKTHITPVVFFQITML